MQRHVYLDSSDSGHKRKWDVKRCLLHAEASTCLLAACWSSVCVMKAACWVWKSHTHAAVGDRTRDLWTCVVIVLSLWDVACL